MASGIMAFRASTVALAHLTLTACRVEASGQSNKEACKDLRNVNLFFENPIKAHKACTLDFCRSATPCFFWACMESSSVSKAAMLME